MEFSAFPGVGLRLFVVVGGEKGVGVDAGLVGVSQDSGGFFNGENAGGVFGEDSGFWMKGEHLVWKRGKGEKGKIGKGGNLVGSLRSLFPTDSGSGC